MSKISAVIDKSLFHELCKLPDAKERERLWHELHQKYQLVVPLMLIEETIVNAVAPGTKSFDEVERLIEQVALHSSCWLEDVHEIVFRELVEKARPPTLPPLADPMTVEIFKLRRDDDSLKRWVEERKEAARTTHNQWRDEQKRLVASAQTTELKSELELFDVVRSEFLRALLDENRRKEMLEHILGVTFRSRHQNGELIDKVFSEFTPKSFTNYYVTLAFLQCRLAYVLAPVFTLPGSSPTSRLRFLKQEANNVYDAEYVTSALICDRFLTRDEKQARMCRIFELAGFWKGKVVYISPGQDIRTALPSAII